MDVELISMIAAGIGVVATVVFVVLGIIGVKSLKDIRDRIRRDEQ